VLECTNTDMSGSVTVKGFESLKTQTSEWTHASYAFTTEPDTRSIGLKFGMLFGDGNRTNSTDLFYLDDDRGTITTLGSSTNPSVYGQPVTFTATVAPIDPAAGMPSGTVQFKTNGGNFGSAVNLSGGSAKSDDLPATLPPGTYAVTAEYRGDVTFTRSTGTLAGGQTIDKANSITVLVSSQNPSVYSEPVNFTATVTVVAPGAGNPTGTVQFKSDGTVLGPPAALDGSNAISTTFSDMAIGTHTITAEYNGDDAFNASTDTLAGGQTVNGQSALQIGAGFTAGSNIFEWAGTSSWHYTVQYSTSLYPSADWTNLPGYVGTTGRDGTMSATDTNSDADKMYYRIKMTR